jgi:hypothetical protein
MYKLCNLKIKLGNFQQNVKTMLLLFLKLRILVVKKYFGYFGIFIHLQLSPLPQGEIIYVKEIIETSRHVLVKNETVSTLHIVRFHSTLGNYIIDFMGV